MRAPAPIKAPAERARFRLVMSRIPPAPTGWKKWARVAAFVALCVVTGIAAGGLGIYYKYSPGLPEIPKVDEYWPPIVTEVYTDDAVLAGEFYNERRKVVRYDHVPKRLVQAFIASEDSSFFDHA